MRRMMCTLSLLRTSACALSRPNTSDYRSILLQGAPLLDVRAPIEFQKGSLPTSVNHAILDDEQRHLVGTCYKQNGQAAAIDLGNSLVSKTDRVPQWAEFCCKHPEGGYLYCFRGGMRSHIAQQWILEETGIRYPLIEGGYKAMRRFLIEDLQSSLDNQRTDLVLICGRTGSGKTKVVNSEALKHCSIDLEGLAHHRGSTFGKLPEDPDQPGQIDFENNIAIAFLKLMDAASSDKVRVFLEDEGARIGKLVLPLPLRNRMDSSNGIVIIDEGLEERVDVLMEDYVFDLHQRFVAVHGGELGPDLHRDYLLVALRQISRRLGGDRTEELTHTMETAFEEQKSSGDTALHRVWIAALLEHYYDKLYDYQLSQKKETVLFRGTRDAVIEWAASTTVHQIA